MRKIRFPSPAMVVSLVALFVALGGAGFGAKNGRLAGPAGQGLYGNGDGCFFGGFIFG